MTSGSVGVGSFVVWATLMGTPILALLAAHVLASLPWHLQLRWFAGLLTCVLGVAGAAWVDVSTLLFDVDVALVCCAYLAWGVLALSACRIRPRWRGVLVGVAASSPLLVGLFMGTVGALGLVFILGDRVPDYVERDTQGLTCRLRLFGNATTDVVGYDLALARPLAFLPWLEHVEYRQVFPDESPPLQPAEICQTARLAADGRGQ